MKKNIFLIIPILFTCFIQSKAQTNVSGTLPGNTTWDLSGSPYIITGDVILSQGNTLFILPLVEVKFDGLYKIRIDGTLRAIGSPDSLIEFSSNTFVPSNYKGFSFTWTAIDYNFSNGTGCILQYCRFQNAGAGSTTCNGFPLQAVIESEEATPFVDNCIFYNCIDIWKGCQVRSDFYFTNNKVVKCGMTNLLNCDFDFPNKSAVISCNLFKNNISLSPSVMEFSGGRTVNFTHNIIASNYIVSSGVFIFCAHLNFTYNSIYDNHIGTYFQFDIDTLKNNLFANNQWDMTSFTIIGIDDTLSVNTNNNFINNPMDTVGSNGQYMLNHIVRQYYLSPHINATSNYWGTTDVNIINEKIYDYYDDTIFHHIDYLPFLTSPDINAPVSPVQNFTRTNLGGNNVQLSWDANPESDIAGYRIYWGNYTGYSFSNHIDVGNVTLYTLPGAAPSDSIAITAYDNNSSSFTDFCTGQESWYSMPHLLPVGMNPTPDVEFNLSFYPNPANELLVISSPLSDKKELQITISDITGKEIFMKTFTDVKTQKEINVKDFSAGIYFIRIITQDGMDVKKFVKE